MRATNQVDVVLFEELFDDSLAEGVRDAPIVFTPRTLPLLWVRPQKIAQETILGHLSWSGQLLELSYSHEFGGKTSVHTENFVVNECRNGHTVEDVLEFFPRFDAKTSLTLVIEPINAIDLTAFVISAQQKEVLLVFHLVRQQQNDSLQRLATAIDIVAQE